MKVALKDDSMIIQITYSDFFKFIFFRFHSFCHSLSRSPQFLWRHFRKLCHLPRSIEIHLILTIHGRSPGGGLKGGNCSLFQVRKLRGDKKEDVM